jgi:hypothetical protein
MKFNFNNLPVKKDVHHDPTLLIIAGSSDSKYSLFNNDCNIIISLSRRL